MNGSGNHAGRALITTALVLAFYLAVGSVLAGLVLAVLRESTSMGHPGAITLFFGLGAVLVVWGVVFLRGRGRVRGPLIHKEEQPELFDCFHATAAKLGVQVPRRVRFAPHAGTEIIERHLLPGISWRSTLYVGIAFMEVATVGSLRGVLAYQLARTAAPAGAGLSSWLARVHDHLERVVRESTHSVYTLPFELLARGFLRLSRPVSLEERKRADAQAARIVGKEVYARSMLHVFSASQQYALFLRKEILILLSAGGIPDNLFEGFHVWRERSGPKPPRVADPDDVEKATDRLLEELPITSTSRDEIRERRQHLRFLPDGEPWDDAGVARDLLRRPEEVESVVTPWVVAMFRRQGLSSLKHEPRLVPWDDVVENLIVPQQQARARHVLSTLRELSNRKLGTQEAIGVYLNLLEVPDMRARLAGRLEPSMASLPPGIYQHLIHGILVRFLGTLVGAALTEAADFRWNKHIGEPLQLVGGEGEQVNPFSMAQDLLDGKVNVRVFRMQLFEHGLFGSYEQD